MSAENEELLTRFYEAFSKRDGEGMAACYHDDATFSDPVFPNLDAAGVRGMWKMLTHRGKDLKVEASAISANDDTGSAHWEAWYTFSQTGRKVHNIIEARFEFKDGLILRHEDTFDLYRWTKHAMGFAGTLLGWGPLQIVIRKSAGKELTKYLAKHG